MYPNIGNSPIPDKCDLKPGTIVYDLIYNPKQTKFLSDAQKQCSNCKIINGMEMLVVQALASINIWTGCSISKETILSDLNK